MSSHCTLIRAARVRSTDSSMAGEEAGGRSTQLWCGECTRAALGDRVTVSWETAHSLTMRFQQSRYWVFPQRDRKLMSTQNSAPCG